MNISFHTVYVVRNKKLRNDKTAIRKLVFVPVSKNRVETIAGKRYLVGEINHPKVTATIRGLISSDGGSITADVEDVQFSGYFKGRGFEIKGYDVTAQVTNLGRPLDQASS